MIKKLRESKFVFDELKVSPLLEIHQFDIVNKPTATCKVYLTKQEGRSLYKFLKRIYEQ